MPTTETQEPERQNSVSQRIERAEIDIVYKDEASVDEPLEENLVRDLRRDFAQRLNEFAEKADVQSVKIVFQLEDN